MNDTTLDDKPAVIERGLNLAAGVCFYVVVPLAAARILRELESQVGVDLSVAVVIAIGLAVLRSAHRQRKHADAV